ncbi:hypothetical protein CAPTEDRAFT_223099 [Capitella teleta]|uniref:Protein MMS22-like n=1 Tax=Capitella teleta TaxID=283909 RepID=R7UYS6_CAPTE|nr:hypothetical protein CAPTEDRAFT_223099 [Capitella teleta]|eukprot:ELU11718.1 hypothetical protein CAPTEDRAFT_223099 [Capitella teleta]
MSSSTPPCSLLFTDDLEAIFEDDFGDDDFSFAQSPSKKNKKDDKTRLKCFSCAGKFKSKDSFSTGSLLTTGYIDDLLQSRLEGQPDRVSVFGVELNDSWLCCNRRIQHVFSIAQNKRPNELDSIVAVIIHELHSLCRLLGPLPVFHSLPHTDSSFSVYFHLHLSVTLNITEIIHIIFTILPYHPSLQRKWLINTTADSEEDLFTQIIQKFILDLLPNAVHTFQRVSLSSCLSVSPWTCSCIAELLVILIHLLQHRQRAFAKPSFWLTVTPILEAVLQDNSMVDECDIGFNEVHIKKIPIKDRVSFSWWFLQCLVLLFNYDSYGNHSKSSQHAGNAFFVETLLKYTWLEREEFVRFHLRCFLVIYEHWDGHMQLMDSIWNHYARNLDKHFHVTNGLQGAQCINLTTSSLLQQVMSYTQEAPEEGHETSYDLFLRIVAAHFCKKNLTTANRALFKGQNIVEANNDRLPGHLTGLLSMLWGDAYCFIKSHSCSLTPPAPQLASIAANYCRLASKQASLPESSVRLFLYLANNEDVNSNVIVKYIDLGVTLSYTSPATFLQSLSDHYRDINDFRGRMVFKQQMQPLFSDVHRHVQFTVEKRPSHEAMQVLYAFMGHMIKSCSSLIYVKSQSDCLLPRILQILLIRRKPLSPLMQTAFCTNGHMFLVGLSHLDFSHDPYLNRKIREIVALFLQANHSEGEHPLLLALSGSRSKEFRKFVLQILCEDYLTQQPVLAIIEQIVKTTVEIDQLAEDASVLLCPLVELIIRDGKSVNFIKFILEAANVQVENSSFIDQLQAQLSTLLMQHFPSHEVKVLRALEPVCRYSPHVMQRLIPMMSSAVKNCEHKRGVSVDKTLRGVYCTLLGYLGREGEEERAKFLSLQ